MDKKNVTIFTLIAIVLILGFLQIGQLINNENTNKITGEIILENTLNKTEQNIEEELIVLDDNFTLDSDLVKYEEYQIEECEKEEEGIKDRDLCYNYYAVDGNKYIYCEQINDDEKRDSCYFNLALGENTNISTCELISTTSGCTWHNGWNCKDACYYNIAIKEKVEFYCGNIESYENQISCVKQIPEN